MKSWTLTLAMVLLTSIASAQDIKGIHGWIEDGIAKTPGTSADAVKKNIATGAPYVFVDDKGKRVWTIDDPNFVKGHEGHHVSISGGMDKTAMTVHISKITMLKDQKPGAEAEAIGH